jgi:predicted nucleic acid-binding protein
MASRKIFIDASVLYAFVDRADPNHGQATKAMDYLSVQGAILFTSIQAVTDTYTGINTQLGTSIAIDFLQAMSESSMEILYPQKADMMTANRLLKTQRSQTLTLKEALTASMMQRRNITQILTFTYWHNLLGSQTYMSRF